jgi:hypothetical protein
MELSVQTVQNVLMYSALQLSIVVHLSTWASPGKPREAHGISHRTF